MKPRSSKLDRIDQPKPEQRSVKSLLGTPAARIFSGFSNLKMGEQLVGQVVH
jgi:hypothetical protein